MVDISHRERIVRAKIIYYGPAAGGKTTNLVVLHRRADPARRGELVSVNSTQDRTILMDLLPVKTPAFRGYDLRFQVIAVPGQRMYAASRRLLLNGADSIVFVANSAADRWEETLESLREMNENLLSHGLDPSGLPVVFQYNKRDLPEVTPLEAMERTLNARRSDGIPAVAIREEGVLETFAAVLARTMDDLTRRYQLGESLRGARSVRRWVDESMRLIFGWKPRAESAEAEESEPEGRIAVRVPVTTSGGDEPSAATPASDPQAAEALVESYAEAARDLTTALEELREENDTLRRRLEELGAPIDAAQRLLAGDPAERVLREVVDRIGHGLGSDRGSLSLVRPDGRLRPVVLRNLEAEPLFTCRDEQRRPLAAGLVARREPVVFVSGDAGPLGKALEALGDDATALVAIPVRTHARRLGLLTAYLPQESPVPPADALPHLGRLGQGLALALEVAAVAIASERLERMERTAVVGQLAERALLEIGAPLDRLFQAVGRIRGRPDGPTWLLGELLGIGTDLARTKELRDGVLGFMAGRPTTSGGTALAEILEQIDETLAEPLRQAGVRLEVDRRVDGLRVRADAFLLRAALAAIVEQTRTVAGGRPGGVVRIGAKAVDGKVHIRVADDPPAATAAAGDGVPDYLAWSLDRRLESRGLALVKTIVEHFRGQWRVAAREGEGTEFSLVLPLDAP